MHLPSVLTGNFDRFLGIPNGAFPIFPHENYPSTDWEYQRKFISPNKVGGVDQNIIPLLSFRGEGFIQSSSGYETLQTS